MTKLAYALNGFAPGNYSNHCHQCSQEFTGDKRAITCEPCALFMLESAAEAEARIKHAGQLYGNGQPYVDAHIVNVVAILRQFDFDEFYRAAGWLHDVIEDTDADFGWVENRFGPRVTELVWACTGVGHNRRTRNASIYAKIKAYPDGAIVKVADRIANVEASGPESSHRSMYLKERETFHELVASYVPRGLVDRLGAAYSGR